MERGLKCAFSHESVAGERGPAKQQHPTDSPVLQAVCSSHPRGQHSSKMPVKNAWPLLPSHLIPMPPAHLDVQVGHHLRLALLAADLDVHLAGAPLVELAPGFGWGSVGVRWVNG
jgi:hypothetical protein